MEVGRAVGQDCVEDPINAFRRLAQHGFQGGIVLDGGSEDNAGECVADMVVYFGGDLHATGESGLATGFVQQERVAEAASHHKGIQIRGEQALCFVEEDIHQEATGADEQGGSDGQGSLAEVGGTAG